MINSKLFRLTTLQKLRVVILEKWPIAIFQGLLPRVYQIVEEINRRLVIELRQKFPNDYYKHEHMAIIHNNMVYMAWMAIHACFSVNGVAALHTELGLTTLQKLRVVIQNKTEFITATPQ